jgi:putative glutathione S-transferase
MGLLVDGKWRDDWYDTASTGGRFVRPDTVFHGTVTADGSSGYKAEAGRYRLFVSLACPWAHRTLIFRKLKKLEEAIPVTVVQPVMGAQGWLLEDGTPLHTVYTRADPSYTGRVTVPVLWDDRTKTIVNNESAEIIRMLNGAFDAVGDPTVDFYPEDLRAEIDAVNDFVYPRINNGVYRAGFATTQEAYEEAVDALFEAIEEIEARLGRQRYLVGDRLTEADWRLFTTMIRFDPVYHGHFKCNLRRLVDYPNLWGWTRELYQNPGVAETVDFGHIKVHYYGSHKTINPTGIVPKGPILDLWAPHRRESVGHRRAAE